MSSRAPTQADATRLIKAALNAGIGIDRIAGVKLTRDDITLLLGKPDQSPTVAGNEWDEVLNK